MKIVDIPFTVIDWSEVMPSEHQDETGSTILQTVEKENLRIRMVCYTAGCVADHWCSKGHVVHVLEGKVIVELQDGRVFDLVAGNSFIVSDDIDLHRSRCVMDARVLIVD